MSETKTLVEVGFEGKALTIYSGVREKLEAIKAGDADIAFNYEDPIDNKMARSYVSQLRRLKGETDRARKTEKQASLDYGRKVDAAAKEITAEIEHVIDRHAKPLKEIEQREKDRIESIKLRVAEIKESSEYPIGTSLVFLGGAMERLEAIDIDDSFGEFMADAYQAKKLAVEILGNLIIETKNREAEKAELAKLRKAEADRKQKEREEQIRKDAKEKAEKESAEREQRIIREAEEAKLEEQRKAEKLQKEKEDQELKHQEHIRQQEEARKRAEAETERLRKAESDRLLREEQEKQALVEKRNQIKSDIKKAIVSHGISSKLADVLVKEIIEGNIPHLKVIA